MRDIANDERMDQNDRKLLGIAYLKLGNAIIEPLISLVDNAFVDPNGRGPVYAINLLSARHHDKQGILRRIEQLLNTYKEDAQLWEDELGQTYVSLQRIAEEFDGKMSVDPSELNSFTNAARQYGEDWVKVRMLQMCKQGIEAVFHKLNDKNNTLFEIYTTTLETLLALLKKDGEYLTDTSRHREGDTTVFHFDISDFKDDDPKSQKYKQFFDAAVDNKDLDKHSKMFINDVMVRIKGLIDPADGKGVDYDETDIVNIVRDFFRTAFSEWTENTIEKFCIIAYSTAEVTPEQLTQVWEEPQYAVLKQTALTAAAKAIDGKLQSKSKVLLTSSNHDISVEKFNMYFAKYGIQDTPQINKYIPEGVATNNSEWSEFIYYKRSFNFSLPLLAELEECRKLYNTHSGDNGVHLDEVGEDWRTTLPNPFDYMIAKQYTDSYHHSNPTTKADYEKMLSIYNLAKQAEELGLFKLAIEADDGMQEYVKDNNFYKLVYKFKMDIDPKTNYDSIYSSLKTAITADPDSCKNLISALEAAGYEFEKPIEIRWHFKNYAYDVMQAKTDFGDEINFGNLIVLINSNYDWYQKLINAVQLFGELNDIFHVVKQSLGL